MQKTKRGNNSKRGGKCDEKFQESSHIRNDQEKLKTGCLGQVWTGRMNEIGHKNFNSPQNI